MGFSAIFKKKSQKGVDLKSNLITEGYNPQASYGYKPYIPAWEVYDGEKNYGELGRPINYQLDFRTLAIRSWQSYYESDITQIAVKNYLYWVIGEGLKLESKPVSKIIQRFEASFNRDEFVDDVEALWDLYIDDKGISHNGMQDLQQLSWEVLLNSIVGGDCLIVMRYEGGNPTIQIVDGLNVMTPTSGNWQQQAKARGNRIRHGVELDKKDSHIAYYIHEGKGNYKRVLATHQKTKRPTAWMVYGQKYRTNDVRGMSLFAVVLENLKKLDRFKEASISSAEERAKLVYSIEHSRDSTGENPLGRAIAQSMATGQGNKEDTEKYPGDDQATKLAMTTGNTVINNPIGASLKALKSESEGQFSDFFTPNFDIIIATLHIPPEVALSKYNSNYSASRMAVKSWEHVVKVDRLKFYKQFHKPIYNFWLDMNILEGVIIASGYISARLNNNKTVLKAFAKCAFEGANMPYADPVKEVKAELMKLGNDFLPISTREKVAKNLSSGDWRDNISRFKEENKYASDLIKQYEGK